MVQTFLVALEDENGVEIDFNRFGYKKLDTCIKKYTEFIKRMSKCNWFMENIARAKYLRFYQTDYATNPKNMVCEIPFKDFVKSLEK